MVTGFYSCAVSNQKYNSNKVLVDYNIIAYRIRFSIIEYTRSYQLLVTIISTNAKPLELVSNNGNKYQ